MRLRVILKKCISCLTLAGFALMVAGCGTDSMTAPAPGPGKTSTTKPKKPANQAGSTTGPGKEEAEPKGRDVPDAAPAEDKPADDKPADEKKPE